MKGGKREDGEADEVRGKLSEQKGIFNHTVTYV